jgi:hypothetical protein
MDHFKGRRPVMDFPSLAVLKTLVDEFIRRSVG